MFSMSSANFFFFFLNQLSFKFKLTVYSVRPNLGPKCLQRLSADDKKISLAGKVKNTSKSMQ